MIYLLHYVYYNFSYYYIPTYVFYNLVKDRHNLNKLYNCKNYTICHKRILNIDIYLI